MGPLYTNSLQKVLVEMLRLMIGSLWDCYAPNNAPNIVTPVKFLNSRSVIFYEVPRIYGGFQSRSLANSAYAERTGGKAPGAILQQRRRETMLGISRCAGTRRSRLCYNIWNLCNDSCDAIGNQYWITAQSPGPESRAALG